LHSRPFVIEKRKHSNSKKAANKNEHKNETVNISHMLKTGRRTNLRGKATTGNF